MACIFGLKQATKMGLSLLREIAVASAEGLEDCFELIRYRDEPLGRKNILCRCHIKTAQIHYFSPWFSWSEGSSLKKGKTLKPSVNKLQDLGKGKTQSSTWPKNFSFTNTWHYYTCAATMSYPFSFLLEGWKCTVQSSNRLYHFCHKVY